MMKQRQLLIPALLMLCAFASAGWAYRVWTSTAASMSKSAQEFLASLDAEQRKVALKEFGVPEQMDWHIIPKPERKGLQIKFMNENQRVLAKKLLESSLSEAGFTKATIIMEMEGLLKELEKTKTGTPLRDTERYYFTLFGEPKADAKWGLSIEGHHMSLNFVVDKDEVVASTPTVYAANPTIVPQDHSERIKKGLRFMADEELLAFKLVNSLSDDQKKKTIIAEKAPSDIRNLGVKLPPQEPVAGIPWGELNADQQALAKKLIEVYANNLPKEIADHRMSEIEKSGWDKVHFAWAGALKEDIGHYYRFEGPTFIVELCNVQPDAAGNIAHHIHSGWRDPRGDFGVPVTK